MWPIGNLLVAVLLWPLQLKRRPRIGGVLVAAVALGCALYGLERWTLKLAEQSPPTAEERLQVNVTSNLGTPPEGMRGSIKWEPEYTYILLLIDDPGPTDFDNLDMTVSFDLAIASMDQYTKFSGVSMFPDLPVRLMGGSVTTVDKSGNKLSIPAYAGEVTSSSAYRIRCEHVPRRSAIEFVAAGVVLNIPTGFSVYEPGKEYGPKRLPTLMSISGSYKVGPKLVNFANNLKLVPQ
jgi:hypothetical protein